MILVTAAPYSGTGYIQTVLRNKGIDVGHEKFGQHGIVSWKHASPLYFEDSEARRQWEKKYSTDVRPPKSHKDFSVIWHQTRDPLKTVSSLVLFNGWQIFDEQFGNEILESDPVVNAMILYVQWNLLCEQITKHQYRVEDVKSDIPTDTHSKKHRPGYRLYTWNELHEIDYWWCQAVQGISERYGYEIE